MGYDLKRAPKQPVARFTYQDYLDRDRNPAPESLRETGTAELGTGDVDVARYTTRDFYERERGMWDRAWQVACREEHIPNPGDTIVYDIAKRSYLVTRLASGAIKAYPNACLHRGRRLRTASGTVKEFRCPFHGFTWSLEGALTHVPCEADFPQVAPERFRLPDVKTGTFAGWVFINPDPDAIALERYLDPIKRHFAPYLWEQSYLAVHVGKHLKGNWKVVQEAFMESFHALDTHPQIMSFVDDFGCQYDQWTDKPHVNRMMALFVAPSPYVADQVNERDVLADWLGGGVNIDDPALALSEGRTARQTVADMNRKALEAQTGVSLAHVSDAELVDGWYYNVFPNLMHWGGFGPNMWYRFRPYEDSHEDTLMEVGFIMRHPADRPKPAPAPYIELDLNQPWASVPALGSLGGVLDQDTTNMAEIQKGLNATFKPGVTLSRYQESRIRHFHQTLDRYVPPKN